MENNRTNGSKAPSIEEFFSEEAMARRKANYKANLKQSLLSLLVMQKWYIHQAFAMVRLVDMILNEKPREEIVDYVKKNFQ